MGEFRIGRTRAQHSYPDTRGGASFAGAFARNFAKGTGNEGGQAVTTAGVQLAWGSIDVPANPPTAQDVPITPHVSGVVLVSGEVTVQNTDTNPRTVFVQVQVDGITVTTPAPEVTVNPANTGEETNGFEAIPFLVELTGLVPGTTVNIQLLVSSLADGFVSITVNDSTMNVQEVLPSTG